MQRVYSIASVGAFFLFIAVLSTSVAHSSAETTGERECPTGTTAAVWVSYNFWADADLDQVQRELYCDADPNAQTKNGRTPLHWAVKNETTMAVAVVQALLDAGANPNAQTESGSTPLHWAAESESVTVVEALLDAGADPNAQTENGSTPLHWAVHAEWVTVVKALLDAGADPNAQTEDGWTPLKLAEESEDSAMLKLELLLVLLQQQNYMVIEVRRSVFQHVLDRAHKDGWELHSFQAAQEGISTSYVIAVLSRSQRNR